MKNLIYLFAIIFCLSSENACSQEKPLSQIVGKWQLLSFERGNEIVDYTSRNVIWNFDKKYLSVMSDDLKGRINGRFYFRRSVFRVEDTYVLKCNALTNTHLPYGKLVIKTITKNKLIFTDWDNKLSYSLKRIE